MKIPNKQEPEQVPLIISQILLLKTLQVSPKICSAKPFYFLVIFTTLASDIPLRFRCKHLERIQKIIITIGDKNRVEKLQCDINKEVAINMNTLKVKRRNLTFQISQIREQAKFTYSF